LTVFAQLHWVYGEAYMTIAARPAEGTQEGPVSGVAPSMEKPRRPGFAQRLRNALTMRRLNVTRRRQVANRRRIMAGRRRVEQRVEMLGPQWRVVDYHPEDPDFLAIGPGGIFQVTVVDHGRSTVDLAGDVVQIGGRRPPYVALARRDAGRI